MKNKMSKNTFIVPKFKIYHFIPWNSDKNIGKSYNEIMSIIGSNDWVLVDAVYNNYPKNLATNFNQVTKTIYDQALPSSVAYFTNYGSDNTFKRVTGVLYFNSYTATTQDENFDNAIFYDYDVHGNVRELVQRTNDTLFISKNHHIKKIVYEYE